MAADHRAEGTGRPITAHDVAKRAGVSQSAVSRAFTPGASISEATRVRVVTAARELGYRPNLIARSLITQRSMIIGVAVGYLENQFNPKALESISQQLQAHGYHLLLFTPDQHGMADVGIENVLQFRVDGLILCSASLSSNIARECVQAGVPIVLFNRTISSALASSVTGDNIEGARRIAEFLVRCGRRRLAFMAGIEESSTSQDREFGFTSWLRRNGFPAPTRVVGNYEFEQAKAAARTLCQQEPRPDALFCANDHMAIAALEVCRHEFGLRVPDDIAVVGFDDVSMSQWPSFSLTTYSQPVEIMAAEAVRLLFDLIEAPNSEPRQVVVQGDLIVRSSTPAQ